MASGRGASSSASTATRIAATGVRSWCDTCDENERSRCEQLVDPVVGVDERRAELVELVDARSARAAGRRWPSVDAAHAVSSSIGRLRRRASRTPTTAATAMIATGRRASRASDRRNRASLSRAGLLDPHDERRVGRRRRCTGTAATRSPST